MKCDCKYCGGEGTITTQCEECDGEGQSDYCISRIEVDKGNEDLVRLKEDAARVIRDTERLIAINPAARLSYENQRDATLKAINKEADSLE